MITKITPLAIYLQIVVILVLTNYYFNPLVLSPSCNTANVSSQLLGKGIIVDCASCLFQDSRDMIQSKLIGDIDVLLPIKQTLTENLRLPIDQVDSAPDALGNKLMFVGRAYEQSGCSEYKCEQWLIPNDFELQRIQSVQLLKTHQFEQLKEIQFYESNSILKNLFSKNSLKGKQYKRVSSSMIEGKDINSLMLRFRYNLVESIQEEQPIFLFHSIMDNLLVRLLLIAPLFLEATKIHSAFSFLSYFSILILFGFVSEYCAVVASMIAILAIAKGILHQKLLTVLLQLMFLGLYFVSNNHLLPIYVLCICGLSINASVFYFWKKNNQKTQLFQLVFLNSFHTILGGIYHWNFLIIISPCLLLAGLLSFHSQSHDSADRPYHNLHFNQIQQQQDVLVRIDKALEKH